MINKLHSVQGIFYKSASRIEDIENSILRELLANGQAEESEGGVLIPYTTIPDLDDYEKESLEIPDYYPFDIYVSHTGAGLSDPKIEIHYSFQDYAGELGNGNQVFFQGNREFAFLKKGELEYLLTNPQLELIEFIEKFNDSVFESRNQVLVAVATLQKKAISAKAVLHTSLADTILEVPEGIRLSVEKVGEDQFRLVPVFENSNAELDAMFFGYGRVKQFYNYNIDGKRARLILPEDTSLIKDELEKIKKYQVVNREVLEEIAKNPSKYWDTDLIDLSLFDERVIELGIYQPKFYPFVSPYKSQWIPGVAIDDGINGVKKISFENREELSELEESYNNALASGQKEVDFKGERIPNSDAKLIINAANKQFENPDEPIESEGVVIDKQHEKKVLIIKENTEELEYDKRFIVERDLEYRLEPIPNLAAGVNLRKHQKNGIAILQTVSKAPQSFPGILLADDMGLGKTIQVLSFIEWYFVNVSKKPVLIVAPVSLLENWMMEYDKFFPDSSTEKVTLWGAAVKDIVYPNDIERTKKGFVEKTVYLTTYETLRIYQIPFGMIDWSLMILDEAQKIKTPGTLVTNSAKAMKADFKLAMTGTPVENTLVDLWCIMDFCIPGLLGNAKGFAAKYQKPQKSSDTDMEALGNELRHQLGDTIIRRMKDDIKAELPALTSKVIEEEMPLVQLQEYARVLNNKAEGNKGEAIKQIHELKQVSDHPFLKTYRVDALSCDEWINSSAKLMVLFRQLHDIVGCQEKVIVFTENKAMQRLIQKLVIDKYGLTPSIVNGETPSSKKNISASKLSRQQEVDRFQQKEGFNIIIMSPLAAGFGLNVTGANHVIHYTRHWNPAKEQQATDRAYRIGQKRDVKVYYPLAVAPNDQFKSFDKVLDELLSRKKGLASSTLFPTQQIEVNVDEFLRGMGTMPELELDGTIRIDKKFIDKCSPEYFEAVVGALFAKQMGGYAYLTPLSGDKGVDVLVFSDQKNLVIQVKHKEENTSQMGHAAIQEICGGVKFYENKHNREFQMLAVTNAFFNGGAKDLAKVNRVELKDGINLDELLNSFPIYKSDVDHLLSQIRI